MQAVIVWAGLIGTSLGILSSAIGLIALYRGSVRKGYAAERDFQHLKNDFKGLSQNIDFLARDIEAEFKQNRTDLDNRFDRIDKDLTELKALQLADLRLKKSFRENDFQT